MYSFRKVLLDRTINQGLPDVKGVAEKLLQEGCEQLCSFTLSYYFL